MNVIDTDLAHPAGAPRTRSTAGRPCRPGTTLHTANAEIVETSPGFVTRFLSTLLDPNLLSLLFLAGIAGIGFEIFHPGVVLPGALGAVSLLLALFGLSVLPTLVDRARARAARRRCSSWLDTHVAVARRADRLGADRARVRPRHALPRLVRPYTTSIPLVVTITVVLGGALGLGDLEGDRGAAAAGAGRAGGDRRDARASSAKAASSTSTASSGRRSADEPLRDRPAGRGRRARRAHPARSHASE